MAKNIRPHNPHRPILVIPTEATQGSVAEGPVLSAARHDTISATNGSGYAKQYARDGQSPTNGSGHAKQYARAASTGQPHEC